MFEYLEPSDHDALAPSPGAGSLPLPPRFGANDRENRPLTPEKLRHLLYGSRAAIDRTIKILHAQGYADPNDWSDPIPVPPSAAEAESLSSPQIWMVILTKTLLIE